MQLKEQLIQKLFAHQCTREELNKLFELIRTEEEETPPNILMTLLNQMKEEDIPVLEKDAKEKAFEKILSKIPAVEATPKTKVVPLKPRKQRYFIGQVAAAVLLLVAASWWFLQNESPIEIVVQTDASERKEIVLPDGSQVLLNGNSTIQYAPNWTAGETRVVALKGEAYFEVAKKETRQTKFQVLTKDLTVEVLGTVFNVNTRQEATKVFLKEGKVQLNLEDEQATQLLLHPGEVVSYSVAKKALVNPRKIAGALEIGILTFRATPLKDILETLAATSNFEFELKTDKFNQQAWTLALPIDNLENAIDMLSTTTGATITKNGTKYVINE